MTSSKRSSKVDRLMIIGVLLLVAWPLIYWLSAPTGWAYADAVEKLKRGELATAKSQFLKLLQKDPNNAAVLFRLGEIAYDELDFESAHQFAKQASSFASANLKLQSIYLEANSLLAMGKGPEAVQAINQVYAFCSLPTNFNSMSLAELQSHMENPGNRRFLNSLAYVMAIANYRLEDAERYISAVIGYFETEKRELAFTIPYLLERISRYQQATIYLREHIDHVNESLPRRQAIEAQIARLKSQLANQESGSKEKEKMRNELQSFEETARYPELYLATNRLLLLSKAIDDGEQQQYSELLKKYESDNINGRTVKLAKDDLKYLDYAAEMSPYYDTRAICYFQIGEGKVATSMKNREDLPSFVAAMQEAERYFLQGDNDMKHSSDLKAARQFFLEEYPDNSLMITLPSDELANERIRKRSDAVELYHQMLFDLARGRLEKAADREREIRSLGFEPNRLLF